LMTGNVESLHDSLMQFDVWRNEWRRISLGQPSADCSTCGLRQFESLTADQLESAAVLCGRQAVQISPSQAASIDLAALTQKLEATGEVKANEYLVRSRTSGYELTVLRDARSILRGSDCIAPAGSLCAG